MNNSYEDSGKIQKLDETVSELTSSIYEQLSLTDSRIGNLQAYYDQKKLQKQSYTLNITVEKNCDPIPNNG